MLSLRGRAAHVGDRLRRGLRPLRRPSSMVASYTGWPASAAPAAFDEQRRRCHRADGDARRLERSSRRPRASTLAAALRDGNVHLVARDEALERRAAIRSRRREASAPRASRRAGARSGRARCRTPRRRTLREPRRPGDFAGCTERDQRRDRVRRPGELLQRLPPRLARDWIWMPPISDAESISPGNASECPRRCRCAHKMSPHRRAANRRCRV